MISLSDPVATKTAPLKDSNLVSLATESIHVNRTTSDKALLQYLELFSANGIASPLGISINSGLNRQYDNFIFSAALAKLEQQSKALTFLEIGCGRSYPQRSKDQGVLWLARDIKKYAAGSEVNLICSDLVSTSEKVLFLLHANGKLSSPGQTVLDPAIPLSTISDDGSQVLPLNKSIEKYPLIADVIGRAEDQAKSSVVSVFCRPALDQELENRRYGINCAHKVDFTALNQFKSAEVDLLWARHLNPYLIDTKQLSLILSSIEQSLREGGQAIVHFDSYDLIHGHKIGGAITWNNLDKISLKP